MNSILDKNIIASVSDGSHGDPFSVLGLRTEKVKGKEKLVLRVFRPEAAIVTAKFGKNTQELSRVSDEGLFEHVFGRRKKKFSYRLEIETREGHHFTIIDPYQFESQISDFDLQLWGEGNHHKAYEFMGAHLMEVDGVKGTHFVTTAPSANRVSVIGSFNNWDGRVHRMRKLHDQGLWELFIPHVQTGDLYKFEIKSPMQDPPLKKSDPYAFYSELRPDTASIVCELDGYEWQDQKWVEKRDNTDYTTEPVSIYELHMGSWRRKVGKEPGFLNYRECADQLVPYVKDLGYTHIELLPIAEHPYDPSWGYQITGYFAPTSRFGKPEDFMYFVDKCHEEGIGVIVDWVPAHFAKDEHGLRRFDGTALYEHEDERKGEHKDWGTCIFNFGRTEVQNFLISNAVYWCDKFHIDGLRVDAVASMLYLDYSRDDGEWVPNKYGGRENLEAIDFLRKFNTVVHEHHPGTLTFAEESTSWGGVSRPTETGGLGFDFKWNMGWMNDTLTYIEKDPVYRKYHQDQLTFSLIYAFSERFTLPFSHDEVVHMKQSMLAKMPGDDWQKFANLRLIYTYMYTHPGKNLLFMGSEFGQWAEWDEARSLDWHLLEWDKHKGVQQLIRDLNGVNGEEKALHEVDFDWRGFEWIDISDADNSIISFIRRAKDPDDFLVVVLNFTPTVHYGYKVGVPEAGAYEVLLNSDSEFYGGSNAGDQAAYAEWGEWHGQKASVSVTIPPLAGLILKPKHTQ
ncbi:1,4-alpha-glucan branching protein GlgB [Balneola sp. MJW-20]|uniref:1,4-alpha-glucan branching protein GlgB n=1 Tax=Gracilimonas aurantiaca TaxID=3234185 RepID=UPI003465B22A